MARVTFVEPDRSRREVEGGAVRRPMLAAAHDDVAGLVRGYTGTMTRAAWQIPIGEAWMAGVAAGDEAFALDLAPDPHPDSRLVAAGRLDGPIVRGPEGGPP